MSFPLFRSTIATFAICAVSLPLVHAQQPNQQVKVAANGVTQAALKVGIKTCAPRINQVTNFIGAGSQVGAFIFAPTAQQDQRVVSISMEVPAKKVPGGKNIPDAYVSASFAPNQANGCGAVYDAIVYWNARCDTVAAKRFGDMKKGRKLQQHISVLEGNGPTKVFLMPAGNGCVSIKKEVLL